MLDALNLDNDDLVLDIGAGYGYSSAVIARIAEAQELLSEHADNVVLHVGALVDGAKTHGPYDAIVIEGGVEALPAGISEQLKDGGRIACLFMEGALGVVRIGWKI